MEQWVSPMAWLLVCGALAYMVVMIGEAARAIRQLAESVALYVVAPRCECEDEPVEDEY